MYFFLLVFIIIFIISPLFVIPSHSEVYSEELYAKCNFDYNDPLTRYQCYKENIERLHECIFDTPITKASYITDQSTPHLSPFDFNVSAVRSELNSTVNFTDSNIVVSKSKVEPSTMPHDKFDNVAEPSIASNGTHVFYTGNYFAAKSMIGGNWSYVDPTFDFKAFVPRGNVTSGDTTPSNQTEINLFLADQRAIYDPHRNIFLWIRLGEPYAEGKVTNILRIGVSNDTVKWTVFDLIPTNIFKESDILDATFDYPQIVLTKNFAYLTSTLVIGENCEKEYSSIFRIPLDNLSKALNDLGTKVTYTAILDRNVTGIAPVDGSYNDTVYFGAHLKNTSNMKIFEWKEDSNSINNHTVSIAPWNNIHNSKYCGANPSDSDLWWCKANTSSRIRSAFLYNESLNFMWNTVTTYDKGVSWKPYIDVATFDISNNMSYDRKYHIADTTRPWIFGSAIPNIQGDLGAIAYYVTSNNTDPNTNPYLNLAFGIFNHSSNLWDMVPLINSTNTLPVKDEKSNDDYNFGDFITIRTHPADKSGYLWDIGGYVLVGDHYYDVAPYLLMIK